MTAASLPILLPSAATGTDAHAPLDWLGRYCVKLVESGPYEWSALPPAARWFCALDTYAGEVSNGGHMQYLQNTRWAADEIEACRAGLKCLPDNPFMEIFEAAVAVVESDTSLRDRFREQDVLGWSADELAEVEERFRLLDQRFFREAGGSEAFFQIAGAALLARPDVRLVEDFANSIAALLAEHPASRKAEKPVWEDASAPWPMDHTRLAVYALAKRICSAVQRRMTGYPVLRDASISVRGRSYAALEVKTDLGLLLFCQIDGALVVYDPKENFKVLQAFKLTAPMEFERMRVA